MHIIINTWKKILKAIAKKAIKYFFSGFEIINWYIFLKDNFLNANVLLSQHCNYKFHVKSSFIYKIFF